MRKQKQGMRVWIEAAEEEASAGKTHNSTKRN